MRALLPALRTAVVLTALAGAVAGGSAIATAAPVQSDGIALEDAGAAAPAVSPSTAQVIMGPTGSAGLDMLGLATGSVQLPPLDCPMGPMTGCGGHY
ncbi:hypothetical protein ACFVUS_40060 [Nocardia sp. NPDC058058]|uniref:hypothetical protein n=1 Tax=Nocardia sp. NPDC058058 TaxID=3346317 RepID=UPI0036DE509E